jgi:hypothetical protein
MGTTVNNIARSVCISALPAVELDLLFPLIRN